MRIKCDCESRCLRADLAVDGSGGGVETAKISASVGVGGANRANDVRTVQQLLNDVTPARGGPVPLLVVDGLCGPKTNAAIRNFQQKQKLPVVDSRADPDGPTMQALNSERANKSATGDRKEREAKRLATAISTIPDAQSAVQRAINLVEAAINFVMLPNGLTTSEEPFKFVSKHFKFDGLSREHTLADLGIIKTTYNRMKTVLRGRAGITGTQIFGANMYAVDPLPGSSPPQAKAYVPKEDDETLKTSLIYLTDSIDGHPRDRFLYLTLHELGHFVDEEDPALEIVDHGYAFFGTVLTLNHDKRMHNAENYAMMAFERSFGRDRLIALYPLLAPMP